MEVVLRVKQGNNPNFSFLLPDDRLFPYYRWMVEDGLPVSRPPMVLLTISIKCSRPRVIGIRTVMYC